MALTPVSESVERGIKEEEITTISVSTAFNPSSHPQPPDTIFRTSDGVWFYGHLKYLIAKSPRAFQTVLGAPLSTSRFRDGPIPIDIPSAEFNIIMHMLYGSSPAAHSPSFETMVQAVDRLPLLDIEPKLYILPNTPLYSQFLSYTPLRPLDIYSMAGHHDLYDLAARCSSQLLSLSLSSITDEQAERMGAIYLKRLLVLHINRIQELRTILMKVPEFHPAVKGCSFTDQKAVSRAWALGSASLIWDAHPDLSTGIIKTSLGQLSEHLTCELCKTALQDRVKEVISRWTSVTRTI
ncbi:hypothetical protein CVT24_009020 [Panaeolus cyanescens]|uniref:BTB domain-containing protein n=1 Tax=Panaeolus cyanescens TaxID=181874 RepID=A0A409YAI6_9AGAR|nr:hypothetical protein CVT24_009020 [Panaeolus cyanescens]